MGRTKINIIKPHVDILDTIDGLAIVSKLDDCARVCYQSNSKEFNGGLIRNIIKNGHTSVLEHASITFDIISDRGVLAELTRHRIGCSYSVESTRYCTYTCDELMLDADGKIKKKRLPMTYIEPIEIPKDTDMYKIWRTSCVQSSKAYSDLVDKCNSTAQIARSVLNMSLKTHIRFSANMRSLRNVFMLRCDSSAHPHIKEIFIPLLISLQSTIPFVFDDIEYDEDFYNTYLKDTDHQYVTYRNLY